MKLIGGAGGIFEVKMGWAELVLVRLMEGNWKPGCQVMTTAGSLSPFQRSFCGLRVRNRTVKMRLVMMKMLSVSNLEAEEGGWMKNTSQQEKCHSGQSDTWKYMVCIFRILTRLKLKTVVK